MRFIKVNSENSEEAVGKRNCIAFYKAKVCTLSETKVTFTNCKSKISNVFNKIKVLFCDTYSRVNKNVVYALVTAVTAFAAVAVLATNFSFAYNAFLEGTELGFTPDKSSVLSCVESINDEFSQYLSGEDAIVGDVVFAPAIIRKTAFTDTDTLRENIKSTSDIMTKSFAVEVDGKIYTALESREAAESVLNTLLSSFRIDDETELFFKEDVKIAEKFVPKVILLSEGGAIERLCGYTTIFPTVRPTQKTTLSQFADENGLSAEYLKTLNPDLDENISEKDDIIIPVNKPVLTVISEETVSYEESVPFAEEVTEDDGLYEGMEKIISKGTNGTNIITEKIERANGKVISRSVIETKEVAAPVMQLRAIGTMPRPDYVGTGSFIRPYYGQISSRFGSRGRGTHTGVDFCGNTGDDILAADNGTVVFSGWSGGYGNIVKIDHNNGYVTYYAHCSCIYVEEGETVKKGQVIAAVGNTGNSTGPHVHFEVHHNDELCNPMNYVN